jgi:5,10-methylene-tetrahydrofolate dehydrogenase/methenyl tetrahydrofolate cyclohydrolase
VGFHSVDVTLPENATQQQVLDAVRVLNADPKVHGVLVQLPLPKHIDEGAVLREIAVHKVSSLLSFLPPLTPWPDSYGFAKDADGFSALNIGNLCLKGGEAPMAIPCTPAGCMELLARSGVAISGKTVCVVGRSNIVGMPVAALLQAADATVTVCHSRTKDIAECIRRADIVVAAIGTPLSPPSPIALLA